MEEQKRPTYSVRTDIDDYTLNVSKWFDLEYTGESEFVGWAKPEVGEFSIGLIVGPSGSGKSLLLRQFGDEESLTWTPSKAIVSHFNSPDDGVRRLGAVGLNNVRAYLKPYHVLSTGEQFRADLARRIKNGAVVDEFTSVVDRNVAKAASKSLHNYVNARGIKGVVLASCHRDIIEWLRPDWYFDTTTGQIHDGRLLRCPEIELSIYPCKRSVWSTFAPHHYLSHKLGSSARCFLAVARFNDESQVVGFSASLPLPSGTLKNAWREHRTVVLPDFQGMGIGPILSNAVADVHKKEGKRYYSKTAHPKLGEYRDKHTELWKPTSKWNPKTRQMLQRIDPSKINSKTKKEYNMINKFGGDYRQTYSHEYIGA